MKTSIFKTTGFYLLGCSLVWSAGAAVGARADGTGGGAAVYLREGLGARALGLGNAATAASESADAAYWNPAALVNLSGPSLASQTAVLGLDRANNFLNYCQPFVIDGLPLAAGLSWESFYAGSDIEARSANLPDPDYLFSDSENAITLSGAVGLSRNYTVGLNFKYLNHQLDQSNGQGVSFDLGFWNATTDDLRLGLVLQDVYSTLKWSEAYSETLPIMPRAGGAYWFLGKTLLVAADFDAEYARASSNFRNFGYHLGAEYKLAKSFVLRAGWDTDRWTAGVGWSFIMHESFRLRFDYAVAGERFPGAGPTHLFSLVMDSTYLYRYDPQP